MNTATSGSVSGVTRGFVTMAMLALLAACGSGVDKSGPRTGDPDTVVVVPDYDDSPGLHPTKIVASAGFKIDPAAVTVKQNGSDLYSVVITLPPGPPNTHYVPTASVSPHP